MKKVLEMPIVLPDDDGIRPAGEPDACFYCRQKVGTPHLSDCVMLTKKVKVKYSYELEVEVPWDWEEDSILYHRNDGTWCADNSLEELQNLSEKLNEQEGCLCPVFKCEVLDIPTAPPYRRNKAGDVVE